MHASSARAATIEPLLSVRRGKSAVEFYKRAFGANELSLVEDDKGEVVAHLSVAGAGFWLADESPSHSNFSPESIGGSTVRLAVTVEDPDAVFGRAVAAGATVVYPMKDQSYGWRVGRLADPFGHHWEIGKPLREKRSERQKVKAFPPGPPSDRTKNKATPMTRRQTSALTAASTCW